LRQEFRPGRKSDIIKQLNPITGVDRCLTATARALKPMLYFGVESRLNYLSPYPEHIESVPEHGRCGCPAHYLVGLVLVV